MGMDLHGKSGNYFRASCWSWRPIHQLVDELNDKYNLALELPYWGSNDGAGLHTQEQCNALADAIEWHIVDWPKAHRHEMPSDVMVGPDGHFLKPGETGGASAYWTDKEHIEQFVTFLRNCGGEFSID
jgi:hypothetical protein